MDEQATDPAGLCPNCKSELLSKAPSTMLHIVILDFNFLNQLIMSTVEQIYRTNAAVIFRGI